MPDSLNKAEKSSRPDANQEAPLGVESHEARVEAEAFGPVSEPESAPEVRDPAAEAEVVQAPASPEATEGQAEFGPGMAPAAPVKDLELMQVEHVLEDGLWEYFLELSPATRAKFKKEGEELARHLRSWLMSPETQPYDVWKVARRWLGSMPGVHFAFLEQESKIKTGEVMKLIAEHSGSADPEAL